ncbi:hypothetical protein [Flavobacterium sp. UBA4197]|uniref:hypothetical protein n=1 Tax=Flavobacterium sp. UBA4197 TaxID=1946546 RepID=UPI00257DD268|nr:hypothetical protein [Flavobacterium sp. UBA4197]
MMKKILFALLLINIVGCSSDNEGTNTDGSGAGMKIKSISEVVYYGSSTSTKIGNFAYEGNKLVSLTDPTANVVTKFVYANNKITQFNVYQNNTLVATQNVSYDGDNLKTVITGSGNTKTEYFYENGILKAKKESTLYGNTWTENAGEEYRFDQNGNVTQVLSTSQYSTSTLKSKYFHDNRNNPFKGQNPYLKYLLDFESFNVFDANNILTQERYSNAESTEPYGTTTYEIQYNANNYPVEIKKINSSNNALIAKTTIVYN